MLTGKLPYPTNKNSEVRIYIVKCKIDLPKKKIPSQVTRDFLAGLLERDPQFRLGANGVQEIMDHPYFKGIDWEALKLKKIKPPYNPRVKSDTDVKHIDNKFLDENIVSYTIDDNDLKKGNMRNTMFEDFTYVKEDTLHQAGRATVFHN